jgi:hypothetical protein
MNEGRLLDLYNAAVVAGLDQTSLFETHGNNCDSLCLIPRVLFFEASASTDMKQAWI